MTVSAHDVAAILRERLPGLPAKKLHKLLYYCQGHHLAAFGEPLFGEVISAWDMGPVVGQLWYQEKERQQAGSPGAGHDTAGHDPAGHDPAGHDTEALTEAELNTIGYVLSRYGALTGRDLENLTHSEMPWQRADSSRRPRESVRIEQDWLVRYFRTSGAPESSDDEVPLDSDAVRNWLAAATIRRADPLRGDTEEELRARLSARA